MYVKKYINDTMCSRLCDTGIDVYNAIEDARREFSGVSAAQETASGSGMFSGQAFQLGADDALTRDERELANRTFQNCMLRVVSGDITEARAQVIMNAMNDDIARAARQSRTDSPLGAELDGSGDVENATEEDLDWQGEINEDNYEWFMNASGEGMQMRARAFLDGEDGEDSDEMD